MVYRENPPPPSDDHEAEYERRQHLARLHADTSDARARSRLLLQGAGLMSVFPFLKLTGIRWIPGQVIHLGFSLWAALLVVWGASLVEQRLIARELRKRKR